MVAKHDLRDLWALVWLGCYFLCTLTCHSEYTEPRLFRVEKWNGYFPKTGYIFLWFSSSTTRRPPALRLANCLDYTREFVDIIGFVDARGLTSNHWVAYPSCPTCGMGACETFPNVTSGVLWIGGSAYNVSDIIGNFNYTQPASRVALVISDSWNPFRGAG